MVESLSMDALREALAPVEALRGEHSQLETWVRESFSAMDALHGELADWQRDLTRQQAALDQCEAALQDAAAMQESAAVAELELQLAQSRDETRQLEEENAEQLLALEDLDRQLAVAAAELRVVNKHYEELTGSLETERERAAEEHRRWMAELRDMRRLLERQGAMLDRLASGADAESFDAPDSGSLAPPPVADEEGSEPTADVAGRTAELRRRATSRRAAQRRPS